jgi:aminoglycoside N3'-acetyltransferase
MLTYREVSTAIHTLGVPPTSPFLLLASAEVTKELYGGASTLVGAVLAASGGVVVPAFTRRCSPQVTSPETPLFSREITADEDYQIIAETVLKTPNADRSTHPLISFAGINQSSTLSSQSLADPFAPLKIMADNNAYILMTGLDHRKNPAIHYAEQLAGRIPFSDTAATRDGILECPNMPGCSEGFQSIHPFIEDLVRAAHIGDHRMEVFSMDFLIEVCRNLIREDPEFLLCTRKVCDKCNKVRKWLDEDGN